LGLLPWNSRPEDYIMSDEPKKPAEAPQSSLPQETPQDTARDDGFVLPDGTTFLTNSAPPPTGKKTMQILDESGD